MALISNDDEGEDTPSGQDISSVYVSYFDEDPSDDSVMDELFVSMQLEPEDGSVTCCDAGPFLGPWFIYGLALVNLDGPEGVAYALGYGDGGFGQLAPGLLKLEGDLTTGALNNYEYIADSNAISYELSDDFLHTSAAVDTLISDSDWGDWPNSVGGIVIFGVTVSASLDGFDVDASLLDQTPPGLYRVPAHTQVGNTPLELTDPAFSQDEQSLSVVYTDPDGNLPWLRRVEVLSVQTETLVHESGMIPQHHDYASGVVFSSELDTQALVDGQYLVSFSFADGGVDSNKQRNIYLECVTGVCEDPCAQEGAEDLDGDGVCGDMDPCPVDANDDTDGDGSCDSDDVCPNDPDDDTDGDGVCGDVDPCPLDADDDSDGDGSCDSDDACPHDADDDIDGDGVCGDIDPCPVDFNDDSDGDGSCDSDDVCPNDPDDDIDGDGVCGDVDPCPMDANDDSDGDGLCDSDDPCPDGVENLVDSAGACGEDPPEAVVEEDECGCASVEGDVPWGSFWILVVLVVLRRRRLVHMPTVR